MKINYSIFLLVLTLFVGYTTVFSQNINGEEIIVGKETITIINFPGNVLNINFSDEDAYDFFIVKRREMKSVSIQFNKEKTKAPTTSLLINEGGRSHMFKIAFDPKYDINDNTRPPLWYDHSNLKDLKRFVKDQSEMSKMNQDQIAQKKREIEEEDKQRRQMEYAAAQKAQQEDAVKKEADLVKNNAKAIAKRKQEDEEINRLAKENLEREKEAKIAQEKENIARIEAEKKSKEAAKLLAIQQQEEAANLKKLKAKKDAEALAKAEAEIAQKRKIEADKQEKELQLSAAKIKEAEEIRKKKELENETAAKKLATLKAAQDLEKSEKKYSQIGLWQRFGSKGINLYEIPEGQMAFVNADFYIISDTLRSANEVKEIISSKISDPINVSAQDYINKGVEIKLENIVFKDAHVYYKLKVNNKTDDDFLLGKTFMYWYDKNKKAKMQLNCSYINFVNFFPLVKPNSEQYIVFVTRLPNVLNEENLVLFIEERRAEKGKTSIVIPGDTYNAEMKKYEKDIKINRNTSLEKEGDSDLDKGKAKKEDRSKKEKKTNSRKIKNGE